MERRGLKGNMGKTKLMVSEASDTEPVKMGRYPCGVCGRRVGVNSKLCTRCRKWCHKRCSGLRSLHSTRDFVCPGCNAGPQNPCEQPIHVDGELVEVVNSFCYPGDVMSSAGVWCARSR